MRAEPVESAGSEKAKYEQIYIIVVKLITICSCITSFVYLRLSAVRFTDTPLKGSHH